MAMSTSKETAKATDAEAKARRAARLKAEEAAEKAELLQSLKALYIPFSLFIACCIFAAGAFMVYNDEPAGWGFIAATCLIALSAFIALFKFQNKFRAQGIIPTRDTIVESSLVDASPETGSVRVAAGDVRKDSGVTAADSSSAAESLAQNSKAEVTAASAGK
jgi:ABC-type iron transport system FetAB permease component